MRRKPTSEAVLLEAEVLNPTREVEIISWAYRKAGQARTHGPCNWLDA